MRYEYVKPDRKFRGPVHWGHVIHLYCSQEREGDLRAFLNDTCGKDTWRFASPWETKDVKPTLDAHLKATKQLLKNTHSQFGPENAKIKFIDANYAMRLKLMWVECEAPADLNPVILPLIRRVMPQVIAKDIIGVQPMQAPDSSILSMRIKGLGL